jgi:hypothetical protein
MLSSLFLVVEVVGDAEEGLGPRAEPEGLGWLEYLSFPGSPSSSVSIINLRSDMVADR